MLRWPAVFHDMKKWPTADLRLPLETETAEWWVNKSPLTYVNPLFGSPTQSMGARQMSVVSNSHVFCRPKVMLSIWSCCWNCIHFARDKKSQDLLAGSRKLSSPTPVINLPATSQRDTVIPSVFNPWGLLPIIFMHFMHQQQALGLYQEWPASLGQANFLRFARLLRFSDHPRGQLTCQALRGPNTL